jgi:hypothetical protein
VRKLLFLLLLWPGLAYATATCTGAVSVGSSSTQIVVANDVQFTGNLRHYLLVQNTGTSHDMYCCMGTSNACTTATGFLVTNSGGQWLMTSQGSTPQVPGGDVACITVSSTTVAIVCDW